MALMHSFILLLGLEVLGITADTVVVAGGFLSGARGQNWYSKTSAISELQSDNSWTQVADLADAKAEFSNGAFYDGTIIYAGGLAGTNTQPTPTTETYLLPSASTTAVASLGSNQHLYIYGVTFLDTFYTILNGASSAQLIYYNRVADAWSTVAQSLLFNRNTASIITYNQYIYFFGGPTQTAERFNPATGTTELLAASLPVQIALAVPVRVGDDIYLVGGQRFGNNMPDATVYKYSPRYDTYTLVTSLNTARTHFAATAANGKIYAVGGQVGEPDAQTFTNSLEVYDPVADTWTESNDQIYSDSTEGLFGHAVNTVLSHDYIYQQVFTDGTCSIFASNVNNVQVGTCQQTATNGEYFSITPRGPAYNTAVVAYFDSNTCDCNNLVRAQTVTLNTCTNIEGLSFVLSF